VVYLFGWREADLAEAYFGLRQIRLFTSQDHSRFVDTDSPRFPLQSHFELIVSGGLAFEGFEFF
jgi:hypothetical protein